MKPFCSGSSREPKTIKFIIKIRKYMKSLYLIALLFLLGLPMLAQDETKEPAQQDLPVRAPFETSILIDNHNVVSPLKGGLEFEIHHRFGLITENGISDLYGIYAPSNIRLGVNYGITDRIMAGFGTTKEYKLQDFQLKYAIIQQTRSGKVPVSLSYYGNMVIDARERDAFGPEEQFRSLHRLSYFSQLIAARKFSEKLSLQLAPGFIYFNAVEEGYKNANFTIHAGGRARVIGMNSIIFEYDQVLNNQELDELNPKPGFSAGVELGTATHCFQIFVSNYYNIISQYNLLYNTNEFFKGDLLLGFNITVRF
jgi:hypothetical protein